MEITRTGRIEANNLRAEFSHRKWNEIFPSEESIAAALKEIKITDASIYNLPYRGYEFINSFARTLQAGKNLSEAQMKQAKRIALEIKIAYEIREEILK